MGLSFWQLAIVVILFLLLFGRGKLPALMSDLAEGIKNFRTGLNDNADSEENGSEVAAKQIPQDPSNPEVPIKAAETVNK